MKTRTLSKRIALLGVFLCLGAAVATPSSAAPHTPSHVYTTCSWPPGPTVKRVVHARVWNQKGLTNPSRYARGIDISMWNHGNSKDINFAYLKAHHRASFVIIKAGDPSRTGLRGAKKWYVHDRDLAKKAGLIVGAYYFGKPGFLNFDDVTKDAVAQAKLALWLASGSTSSTGPALGELPLTLDFEEKPCGWTDKQLATWTATFMKQVAKRSGRTPMIYTGGLFIDRLTNASPSDQITLAKSPLWAASWNNKKGITLPEYPIWGTNWTFWQFTSDGKLGKANAGNRVDLDIFNGNPQQLAELASK